jgi:hypothetical protein
VTKIKKKTKIKKLFMSILIGIVFVISMAIIYFKIFNYPVIEIDLPKFDKKTLTSITDTGHYVLVCDEPNMYVVLSSGLGDYGQVKYGNSIYNFDFGTRSGEMRIIDVVTLIEYYGKEYGTHSDTISVWRQVYNFNGKVIFKVLENEAPFVNKKYITFNMLEFNSDDEVRKYVSEIKYTKTSENDEEYGVFPWELTEGYDS